VTEKLKGEKTSITSFKHVVRADVAGARAVLDWADEGKTAVMFSVEATGGGLGVAYVFIDSACYSVDYNHTAKYWLMIRAEPGMSACYHGSVEQLEETVRAILDGKEVKVPVKEPAAKEDRDQRRKEITEALRKNRGGGP
jgi:hypothetical protein